MKNIRIAVALLLWWAAPALAGSGCGDQRIMVSLYRNAVFAEDRVAAERQLIPAALIVAPCLTREGYKLADSLIPGRFGVVLAILAAMRRESAAMSTAADVDRKLRLWQAELAGKKGDL